MATDVTWAGRRPSGRRPSRSRRPWRWQPPSRRPAARRSCRVRERGEPARGREGLAPTPARSAGARSPSRRAESEGSGPRSWPRLRSSCTRRRKQGAVAPVEEGDVPGRVSRGGDHLERGDRVAPGDGPRGLGARARIAAAQLRLGLTGIEGHVLAIRRASRAEMITSASGRAAWSGSTQPMWSP